MIHRIEILGHWVLSFESFWNCKTLQVSYATLVTWSIWYCFFAVHKKVGDFPHLAADFQKKKVAGEYLGGYHTMFLRRLHNCCRNWTSNVRSVSWREKHGKMKPGIQVDHNGIRVRWFAWNLRISDSTGSRSPTEWNGSRMWQLWTRHSITRMNHFLHDLHVSTYYANMCKTWYIYIYRFIRILYEVLIITYYIFAYVLQI